MVSKLELIFAVVIHLLFIMLYLVIFNVRLTDMTIRVTVKAQLY